jgi:glucose-1-phosphate cytidylyltransferase
MKVVILCGGLGTRLREETVFIPKPMVQIGDRPIIWHVMKLYAHYGHTDFVLALGYKGEIIREYFYEYDLMNCDITVDLAHREPPKIHNNHNEQDWKVTLVDTGQATLKGGRLKRVEPYIGDDLLLVTYGDGLANVNINELIAFHRSHGRIATVTGVAVASRFGELNIEGDQVLAIAEKPQKSDDFANGGFFIFDRRIFDYLTPNEDCDLEVGALERVAQDGQLMVRRHAGFWGCMDTQRDRDYLNGIWEKGNAPWKVW